MPSNDNLEIDALIQKFYACFDNRGGRRVELAGLYDLFVPQAQIRKCVEQDFELYDLEQFSRPREALLNSGNLIDFFEYEVASNTEFMGNIAQRWSRYEKQWSDGKVTQKGEGMKSIQLCKSEGRWAIASIVWDDL